MNKKYKNISIVIISIIIGYLPVCLIAAQFIWYETDIEEKFEHDTRELDDVIFYIWTNPSIRTCNSLFFCPIIKNCTATGPISIGLEAIDKKRVAKRIIVNRAVAVVNSNKRIPLALSDQNNFKFHDNAGDWIVHLYNKDKLDIDTNFSVQIDVEVEKSGSTEKKTIIFPLEKTFRIKKGWVYLHSWS